jgi:hypothetical protein
LLLHLFSVTIISFASAIYGYQGRDRKKKKKRVLTLREFLDMHFPARWVGRDGPTPWPPRSPDNAPLDFFPVGIH